VGLYKLVSAGVNVVIEISIICFDAFCKSKLIYMSGTTMSLPMDGTVKRTILSATRIAL